MVHPKTNVEYAIQVVVKRDKIRISDLRPQIRGSWITTTHKCNVRLKKIKKRYVEIVKTKTKNNSL